MRFSIGEEYFFIRKVPRQNTIEVKKSGRKLLYDRGNGIPRRITEDTDEHEAIILDLINRYFIPETKHNRHRNSYKPIDSFG